MSYYDYRRSEELANDERNSFYSLIMAAMRRADTGNELRLRAMFPDTWAELETRYHQPGGFLPGEDVPPEKEGDT